MLKMNLEDDIVEISLEMESSAFGFSRPSTPSVRPIS